MISTLALALLASTWTVDDDQPADFTDLQSAVSAPRVKDGDVLVVGFGIYGPFTLTKRLSIVGPTAVADALVTGTTKLASPAGFDVSHLHFASLEVENVVGRARLSHCRVGVDLPAEGDVACLVTGCAELLVAQLDVTGRYAPSVQHQPTAVRIESSNVAWVGGALLGGNGHHCFPTCNGGDGGRGMEVTAGSDVLLVDTAILGGASGRGTCGISPQCTNNGRAGDGLLVDASKVRLRDSGASAGFYKPLEGGTPGFALSANASTVTASATPFSGALDLTATTLVTPPQPEPTLSLVGSPILGSVVVLQIGVVPPSAPVLLLASAHPGLVDVPGHEGELWIDPASPFVLVAAHASPAGTLDVLAPIPPDPTLLGLSVELQAAFPTVPGTLEPSSAFVGNPLPVTLVGS